MVGFVSTGERRRPLLEALNCKREVGRWLVFGEGFYEDFSFILHHCFTNKLIFGGLISPEIWVSSCHYKFFCSFLLRMSPFFFFYQSRMCSCLASKNSRFAFSIHAGILGFICFIILQIFEGANFLLGFFQILCGDKKVSYNLSYAMGHIIMLRKY